MGELNRIDSVVARLKRNDPPLAADIRAKLKRFPDRPAIEEWIAGDILVTERPEKPFLRKKVSDAHFHLLKADESAETSRQFSLLIRERTLEFPDQTELLSDSLPQVLLHGSTILLQEYLNVFNLLGGKQLFRFSVKGLLTLLSEFLAQGDIDSGIELLRIMTDLYTGHLSYSEVLKITGMMPGALRKITSPKRCDHLCRLHDLVRQPYPLIVSYLAGLESGLYLLSGRELDGFLDQAFERTDKNPLKKENFLSLSSQIACNVFDAIRTASGVDEVQVGLCRYLQVRTGISFNVTAGQNDGHSIPGRVRIHSDGKSVHVPNEIDRYADREKNRMLYKNLVRLEAGYYEWDTFGFDLERLEDCLDRYPLGHAEALAFRQARRRLATADDLPAGDISRLYRCFDNPQLAGRLFTLCEHSRQRFHADKAYPGMSRRILCYLKDEIADIAGKKPGLDRFLFLYTFLVVDEDFAARFKPDDPLRAIAARIRELSCRMFAVQDRVEDAAALLIGSYPMVASLGVGCHPLHIPFGRVIADGPYLRQNAEREARALNIKTILADAGLNAYTSDIREMLAQTNDLVSLSELAALAAADERNKNTTARLSGISAQVLRSAGISSDSSEPLIIDNTKSFTYPEWDINLKDYRTDHVRVLEQPLSSHPNDFYQSVLRERQGLVSMIRNRFERMKPEQISFVRPVFEGDIFDYTALINHVMDRRIGIAPNENVYMRREKRERDVAVLLLTDLSRSTANLVDGENKSVLQLEKEAMVLFCEALNVVGDQFAMAGYSGSTRHQLEYVWIKRFEERLDDTVKNRIHHIQAIRRTRTGGAIRHSVSQLERIQARVKILLLIGDGFPNDSGYKKEYAVNDTRKAILEAASKHIATRVITVSISNRSGLDDVYGVLRHNVISSVRHLPDKLLNIYSALTK